MEVTVGQDPPAKCVAFGTEQTLISAPVDGSTESAVILLRDWIPPEDFGLVRSNILALYDHPGTRLSMKLIMVASGTIQEAGPFQRKAKLASALDEIEQIVPASPVPAAFYASLINLLPRFGANWSHAILIGRLPDVDAPARRYASALILNATGQARVRLHHWAGLAPAPAFLTDIITATGGREISGNVSDFVRNLSPEGRMLWEVAYAPPQLSQGFALGSLSCRGTDWPADLPVLARAPSAPLASIEQYAALRQAVEEGRAIIAEPSPDAATIERGRAAFERALTINPRDIEALLGAAALYSRFDNHKAAAALLTTAVEVDSRNPAIYAQLGHALFGAGDHVRAEKALVAARDLGNRAPLGTEELARILIARKDDRGAASYSKRSYRPSRNARTCGSIWPLLANA